MALQVSASQLESLTVHEAQLHAALSIAYKTRTPMDIRWARSMVESGVRNDYLALGIQSLSASKRASNTKLDWILLQLQVDSALIEKLDTPIGSQGNKPDRASNTTPPLLYTIRHAGTYGAMTDAIRSAVQTIGFEATYQAIDLARVSRGTTMM